MFVKIDTTRFFSDRELIAYIANSPQSGFESHTQDVIAANYALECQTASGYHFTKDDLSAHLDALHEMISESEYADDIDIDYSKALTLALEGQQQLTLSEKVTDALRYANEVYEGDETPPRDYLVRKMAQYLDDTYSVNVAVWNAAQEAMIEVIDEHLS